MNIHPRIGCGIYAFIYSFFVVGLCEIFHINSNSPIFLLFVIIGLIPLHFVNDYFTKHYDDPRDESKYYDETFKDNPFEDKNNYE